MADSLQEGQFSSYTLACQESSYEPSVLMCIHSHMCSHMYTNMHIYVHMHNTIYVYINIYNIQCNIYMYAYTCIGYNAVS